MLKMQGDKKASSTRTYLKEKESMSVQRLQWFLISLKYMSLFQTVVTLQQPIKGNISLESMTLMQCNAVAILKLPRKSDGTMHLISLEHILSE